MVLARRVQGTDASGAISQEMSATTYLPAGWRIRVGAAGELIALRHEAAAATQERAQAGDVGLAGV